jgi:putative ABC transport system ATP-binding protein
LATALRGQKRSVLAASALVTIHQVAEVLVPVTIGVVIDHAIGPGDAGAAVLWLAVLAGQFVILSAAGCTALYVDERARRRAVHDVRVRLAARVLDAGGGVERALPGEVVSLSTVETMRIGDGVGAVIVGVGAVVGVVAGALILLATSLWLGLVVVIGLPIVLIVVQVLAEPLVERADEHQEAVGVASGVASDLLRGLRVVKGLGADAAASARYRAASREALRAGLDANSARSSYAGFTITIASAFVIVVAWMGARQALDGTISVGELVAALGVTQFLVGPLGRLAYAASEIAQSRASSEHLASALSAPPAVAFGTLTLPATAPAGRTGIRVPDDGNGARPEKADRSGAVGRSAETSPSGNGEAGGPLVADARTAADAGNGDAASVGPHDDPEAAPAGGGLELVVEGLESKSLAGVSFTAAAGEMIAVVAEPVDAAALVDCLDRSVDADGGVVRVGGVDHAELTLDEARRAVMVSHHDAPLFGGTIGENVVAAARSADQAMASVLAAASLDDVLVAVEGGLDGSITDEGRSLSGGQRQRVALARALAADAPVLVLHEPSTAVDTATEHRIAAGIRSLREGRTTIVITASPPLLAAADRVVVIDDGQVVVEGRHAELVVTNVDYRQAVLR